MPTFTIRMVLHKANRDDYQHLATEMANQGFVDTIVSDDGFTYRLPDAEYYGNANSITDAEQAGNNAAAVVGKKFAVFVTEAVQYQWNGLEKVK